MIFCFLISGLFLLTVCCYSTKIEVIKNNPNLYLDQEIVVSGFVTEIINVPGLNNDVFKIDDFSGVIWIYTTKGVLPPEGTKTKVTGILKNLLKIPIVNFEAEYYIELREMNF